MATETAPHDVGTHTAGTAARPAGGVARATKRRAARAARSGGATGVRAPAVRPAQPASARRRCRGSQRGKRAPATRCRGCRNGRHAVRRRQRCDDRYHRPHELARHRHPARREQRRRRSHSTSNSNTANTNSVLHVVDNGLGGAITAEGPSTAATWRRRPSSGAAYRAGGVGVQPPGLGPGVGGVAGVGTGPRAIIGVVVGATSLVDCIEADQPGKGRGFYAHLDNAANTSRAIYGRTRPALAARMWAASRTPGARPRRRSGPRPAPDRASRASAPRGPGAGSPGRPHRCSSCRRRRPRPIQRAVQPASCSSTSPSGSGTAGAAPAGSTLA